MINQLIRMIISLPIIFSLVPVVVSASSSIMIWPIDPKIASGDKATEVWLENHGDTTALMQIRIFSWQQVALQDHYQTQQQIAASPSVVRINANQRQLVRLIKLSAPPAGQETAYRIVIDEIPTPPAPDDSQAGIRFQMRYSVPLFIYGDGLTSKTAEPKLSWRIINNAGKTLLQITNRGNGHARLSNVTIGRRMVADGLMGYVLAGSKYAFPLSITASPNEVLSAQTGKRQWQSRGTL